jgi:hypothetical protein
MARIRLIHMKSAEAAPHIAALRRAGHEVQYEERARPADIRAGAPEIALIDLTRLPSHGREVAVYFRGTKALRHVPLIFAGGDPEKVKKVREMIPDAVYTSWEKVLSAIKPALLRAPADVVVPAPMMERYGNRPVAQKLGIGPGSAVKVVDPPSGFPSLLGEIPEGVTFVEDERSEAAVTLWFIYDAAAYLTSVGKGRAIAQRSKLWVIWPKGEAGKRAGITQNVIREAALDAGLVDYKICAVNEQWSAILFAAAKAKPQKSR